MEGLGYGVPRTMNSLRRFAVSFPLRSAHSPPSLLCGRLASGGSAPARAGNALRGHHVRSQATAVETQQETSLPPPSPAPQLSAQAALPRNPDAPSFQEAIIRLQNYWAKFGCAICQPHNTEVSPMRAAATS